MGSSVLTKFYFISLHTKCGFDYLPITIKHTIFVENLENHHQDPSDRLLIAQAITEELTIITRDNKITQYKVPTILA